MMIQIRPIQHTWLVKVMKCQVGVIRKRSRGVIWTTIKVEKIVVIIHNHTKTNKQINKYKEKSSLC